MAFVINPLVNYSSPSRTDTVAIAESEQAQFDAMMNAHGTTVSLDTESEDEILVLRELPKTQAQSTRQAVPTQDMPNRTTDKFYAKAEVIELLPVNGGVNLTYLGRRYAIQFVKPHEVAGVILFLELHCDIEDGMAMAPGVVL